MPTSAKTRRKPGGRGAKLDATRSRSKTPDVTAPLAALVRAVLESEARGPGEIGIVLTGDAPVRELNRRWRGLDRATDVLSFGYDDTPGPIVNGDLIVSMDRVIEQAARFRVTRGRELARLIVHGALHLAGLDHKTAGERRVMRAREARLLRERANEVRALEEALDRHPNAAQDAPPRAPRRGRPRPAAGRRRRTR